MAEIEDASLRRGDPGIRRGDSGALLDRFVFENASPVAFKIPIGFAFDDSLEAFEPSALLTKYSLSAASSLVVPALLLYRSSADALCFS